MAASKESILHALENSLFEFPELPGRWEVPSFGAFVLMPHLRLPIR